MRALNGDITRRIFALADMLNDAESYSHKVRAYQTNPPGFIGMGLFWFDMGDNEPETSHMINPAGKVVRHTCQYNGHNGDSYGDVYVELTGDEATVVLQGLNDRLERRAMAAEERRLEKAADKRRTDAAQKNLNAFLKSKGVL